MHARHAVTARAILRLANDLKSALHHPWVYVLWTPILPSQTVTMEEDSYVAPGSSTYSNGILFLQTPRTSRSKLYINHYAMINVTYVLNLVLNLVFEVYCIHVY